MISRCSPKASQRQPLGRIGTAEEFANLAWSSCVGSGLVHHGHGHQRRWRPLAWSRSGFILRTARSLSSGARSRDPLAPPQDEVCLWVLMVRSREAASRTMKNGAAGISTKKAPVSGAFFASLDRVLGGLDRPGADDFARRLGLNIISSPVKGWYPCGPWSRLLDHDELCEAGTRNTPFS